MDEIDYKWKEIRDEIEELYKIHQNFPAYWASYSKFLPRTESRRIYSEQELRNLAEIIRRA